MWGSNYMVVIQIYFKIITKMKRKGKVLMGITKHMITAFRNFVFRFEGYHTPHIIRCFFSSFCLHLINEIPTSYIFFSTVRILFNDNLVWNNFSLQFKRSNPKRNTSLMMTVLFKFYLFAIQYASSALLTEVLFCRM